jgi:scyllo-inositol 2-dehydrogenase (NADP+)
VSDIDVVVVGFGLAGRVFHCPFVSAVPGLRLAGIVQRKGDEAGAAYPETTVMRSFEEALASSAKLIVVGTPNGTHFPLAKQALGAGKHVVIDKPFAGTSEEARELIELAAAKGVLVAPFHNRRWDGDFLTLKKVLASGELGRVVTVESHFDRFRPLQREGTWKESEGSVNGLLFDLGPHLVDQALALFGAPKALTASVRTDRDTTEIEDAFDITFHYDRLLMHCRSSMIAADAAPRYLVHGTHGSFRKMGVDPQEPALVSGLKVPRMGTPGVWLQEEPTAWGTLTIAPNPADPGNLLKRDVKTELGDYRGFYASVRDAILGIAPLAVSSEDGFRVVRLLELARVSSKEGRTVEVDF